MTDIVQKGRDPHLASIIVAEVFSFDEKIDDPAHQAKHAERMSKAGMGRIWVDERSKA